MKVRKANMLCPELSLLGNISLVLWICLEGFIFSLSLVVVFINSGWFRLGGSSGQNCSKIV